MKILLIQLMLVLAIETSNAQINFEKCDFSKIELSLNYATTFVFDDRGSYQKIPQISEIIDFWNLRGQYDQSLFGLDTREGDIDLNKQFGRSGFQSKNPVMLEVSKILQNDYRVNLAISSGFFQEGTGARVSLGIDKSIFGTNIRKKLVNHTRLTWRTKIGLEGGFDGSFRRTPFQTRIFESIRIQFIENSYQSVPIDSAYSYADKVNVFLEKKLPRKIGGSGVFLGINSDIAVEWKLNAIIGIYGKLEGFYDVSHWWNNRSQSFMQASLGCKLLPFLKKKEGDDFKNYEQHTMGDGIDRFPFFLHKFSYSLYTYSKMIRSNILFLYLSVSFPYHTVFAIETSCDDTSLAIVSYEDGVFQVPWIQAFSQVKLHEQYGGVMPEIAYRSHAEKIVTMLDPYIATMKDEIAAIVVTAKPGLPGSLIVGIAVAHLLGKLWNKPVIEAHHVLGHVFSVLCERRLEDIELPYLCLTASGGHNDLYIVQDVKCNMQNFDNLMLNPESGILHSKLGHLPLHSSFQFGSYTITKISQTRDDAAGECFDKVARMLGGPYPGGKWISELAEQGSYDERFLFHGARIEDDPLAFSYSGLKSQVFNAVQKLGPNDLDETIKANIAYMFQEAICKDLVEKTRKAADIYGVKTIGICGGVSANTRLRELASQLFQDISILIPKKFVYCTDNAAMIGVVGILGFGES